MKLKTQIKIYQKLVSELSGKFEAEEFINTRIKELCSEHRILEEEVHLYICIYIYIYIYIYIHIYKYMHTGIQMSDIHSPQ